MPFFLLSNLIFFGKKSITWSQLTTGEDGKYSLDGISEDDVMFGYTWFLPVAEMHYPVPIYFSWSNSDHFPLLLLFARILACIPNAKPILTSGFDTHCSLGINTLYLTSILHLLPLSSNTIYRDNSILSTNRSISPNTCLQSTLDFYTSILIMVENHIFVIIFIYSILLLSLDGALVF